MSASRAVLLGGWLAAAACALAADPAKPDRPAGERLPGGRLDLYDAKTRRVEMVVFYDGLTHEPSGDNRFTRPRAKILDEGGATISELLKDPVATIEGETALHSAKEGTFRVEKAVSRFRQVPVSGPDPGGLPPSMGEPVAIDAETLTVQAARREAVYERRVRIRQGALEVDCDRLEVAWDDSGEGLLWARATGSPVDARLPDQGTAHAPEIRIDFKAGRVEAPRGGTAMLRSTVKPMGLPVAGGPR